MKKISNLKVLLLDDDPITLIMLGEILNNLGLNQVTSYESGQEALDWIDSVGYSVDLILLDINMPNMDGMEFIHHLAKRQYLGSLILISGESERMLQTAERVAKSHGITSLGHLEKKLNEEALSELLEKCQPFPTNKPSPLCKTYNANDLRIAMDRHELVNYYQPQIDVATGKVVGVEALVRWLHPQDGIVLPHQFVHIAEAFGLIDELAKMTMEEAFLDTRVWQNQALHLRMSVNISIDNLVSEGFINYLTKAIAVADIDTKDVMLDVTEHQLMKYLSSSIETLGRLRLKHFGVSLDDFGGGASSLALVRNVPFNEIKIGSQFVHGIASNNTQQIIYDACLALAQGLEMKVVVEGIENWEDWVFLRNTHCDIAQGYFIAKPMLGASVSEWISEWNDNIDNFMM